MASRICVDFDRVIHQYRRSVGKGYGTAIDEPVPGAKAMLQTLAAARHKIIIHTSRANTLSGMVAVRNWMWEHQMPHDEIVAKPDAEIYIDDKAFTFRARQWKPRHIRRMLRAARRNQA